MDAADAIRAGAGGQPALLEGAGCGGFQCRVRRYGRPDGSPAAAYADGDTLVALRAAGLDPFCGSEQQRLLRRSKPWAVCLPAARRNKCE